MRWICAYRHQPRWALSPRQPRSWPPFQQPTQPRFPCPSCRRPFPLACPDQPAAPPRRGPRRSRRPHPRRSWSQPPRRPGSCSSRRPSSAAGRWSKKSRCMTGRDTCASCRAGGVVAIGSGGAAGDSRGVRDGNLCSATTVGVCRDGRGLLQLVLPLGAGPRQEKARLAGGRSLESSEWARRERESERGWWPRAGTLRRPDHA